MLEVSLGTARRVIASVVLLVLAGCSDAGSVADPAKADPTDPVVYRGTAEDFDAISDTLAERADAIDRGDLDDFLTTLDTANESTRESQIELFNNLQKLPVESIRYESDDFGDSGDDGAGEGPRLRPDVVEIVRLTGVDRREVENDVNMTFVLRDGRWLLGAEAPFESVTPWNDTVSRPWFGGPIDVARRGPTLVVADSRSPSAAESLSLSAATHLDEIARLLKVTPSRQVLIDATTGGRTTALNAEGSEAGAVFFPVVAPDGQRLSGWRVKFNPDYVDELLGTPSLLRHELTHFVSRNLLRVAPMWLSEGLAEYVGNLPARLPTAGLPPSWADDLRQAEQRLPVSGQFGLHPAVDYPASWAAVTILMDERGVTGIRELAEVYRKEAEGTADIYADYTTPWVLRRVYGFGVGELTRRTWTLIERSL